MLKCDFLIVGSGLAGSVLAERIANELKKEVIIVEKRNHIGGNCYDEYDENGILIHKYGPHIFHTNDKKIVDYLSQFTEWYEYEHKVLALSKGEYFPIPINRITVNKVFNKNFNTDEEVKEFLESIREKRYPIRNSEDIIVNQVGVELFERFFKHYTKKQWNLEPKDLSPTVCGRIPIRFNDDCRYFTDKYQLMPKDGYTKLFERMLNNKNIEIILNTDYKQIINDIKFDKLIYTGPIDYFFNYLYGKLPYRSIKFEYETYEIESYQPVAQVNYVDEDVLYTRVIEHKKLSGQINNKTIISREYPLSEGEPYYPIPNTESRKKYLAYKKESEKYKNLIFCGRLAEYQYYNMDQVIAKALILFKKITGKK